MKKSKAPSIIVLQSMSGKFDPGKPKSENNWPWDFIVKSAKNILEPSVTDRLTKAQLDRLISEGVDVSITAGGN